MVKVLDTYFKLKENNTHIKTEVIAGLTTFLTMSYIIVVNPSILTADGKGVPFAGALTATILVSSLSSILMGLVANLPYALAPGMGINAFFTFRDRFGDGDFMADRTGSGVHLRDHLHHSFRG